MSAEEPGQVLTIGADGRWKEQVVAPEFLLNDHEEFPSNWNSFYGDKRVGFRPERFTEQVKRQITGAEDIGLQSRLVTRVRLRNSNSPRSSRNNINVEASRLSLFSAGSNRDSSRRYLSFGVTPILRCSDERCSANE